MPKLPQISDAEWDVMKVVWDHGPLTAGDVVRHLADERDWRPRTVKTLLSRLVRKGAVDAADDRGPGGRRFLYRARVTRQQCVRQESRSFLSRVFDGSVAPALLHFLEGARLSPDEIRQLRQTLQREEEAARAAGQLPARGEPEPRGGPGVEARARGAGGAGG